MKAYLLTTVEEGFINQWISNKQDITEAQKDLLKQYLEDDPEQKDLIRPYLEDNPKETFDEFFQSHYDEIAQLSLIYYDDPDVKLILLKAY